jgi:hypothetical protein
MTHFGDNYATVAAGLTPICNLKPQAFKSSTAQPKYHSEKHTNKLIVILIPKEKLPLQ